MQFYIDPGTGSMLFTILIGVLGAGIYALRNVVMKMRFLFSGGNQEKVSKDHIPIAIFTDSKRYWNIFGPICKEFDRRGQEVVYLTASADDPALECKFEHVRCEFAGEGNRAFAKLNMLNADMVLSSTPGLDVYQWKRSKDVKYYVHIPHAVSDITSYRMFGLDYYDAVLLTGKYMEHQIRGLEQVRHLPAKELRVVGLPYMDELKKRYEAAGPLPPHETTVLLAPSWGPSSILNRYGAEIFDALLSTGYHIVVRPHPQSFTSEKEMLEKLQKQYPDSDQLEWNSDNDNFEVLRRADILISDFSGVMFDYALVFDKPIIYADTSFDDAPYDACWLDEPMWAFSVLPKMGQQLTRENLGSIKQVIDTCISDDRYKAGRDQARADSWDCIGESAVKTVDFMMEKYAELQKEPVKTEKKPEKKTEKTSVKK